MGVGASGGIRTRTIFLLREAPPASWATDAKMVLPASLELASPPYQSGDLPHDREERIGARSIELNVHLSRYKPEALPVELCGQRAPGLPGSRIRNCARRACPVRAFEIGAGGR